MDGEMGSEKWEVWGRKWSIQDVKPDSPSDVFLPLWEPVPRGAHRVDKHSGTEECLPVSEAPQGGGVQLIS